MTESKQPSVLTGLSFARFVFPFSFPSAEFETRYTRAQEQTIDGDRRPWQASPFSEDDLLQHVHDFLNNDVETCSTAMRWRMTNDALQSRAGLWTNTTRWKLVSEGVSGGIAVPFVFDTVHLSLFSSGVGFLSFTIHPELDRRAQTAPLDTWNDLIHFFRFARGQRDVYFRAQRRTGRETFEEVIPELAQESFTARGDERLVLMDIIAGILEGLRIPSDSTRWWEEIFVPGQMLPYVALFTRDVPEADVPRALYRARNFFNSRQDLRPLPYDLDVNRNPAVLPYVDGAWFAFSLDGGAFVTSDRLPDTGFFTGTLPQHVENLYYVIFLIALHQRFALMRLSNEIAKTWTGDACDETLPRQSGALDRIRRDFTLFTTRGYFAQIAQQEHHHAVYRRWQETFQIPRLYEEVRNAIEQLARHISDAEQRRSNELQEIANAQEAKRLLREQRNDRFISFITALLAGPAFAIAVLQTTQVNVTLREAFFWSVIGLIVSSLVVFLYDLWVRGQIGD